MLAKMNCSLHPSEIQGILCGQLSAGLRFSETQWLRYASSMLENKNLNNNCKSLINQLYTLTIEQLENPNIPIILILPEDNKAIQLRTEALGIWCQSFLSGFGEGQVKEPLNADIEEVLRDFSKISQIESSVNESESAERNLLEVCEYVRVSLVTVFFEINHPQKIDLSVLDTPT
ncbi:MAG: UPF0149 family protein [Candidatus Endonucleobacter bathymodioli]|uniref:UPF0149 family protein n=1 Tax=Candidatus Endonucleibacter bathymodioli TaxID=539814 RepID=A0AA90SNC3_9GAMM|nr:UPF0149 family protein [Candidatus Endonucleobacter bathymodioli]